MTLTSEPVSIVVEDNVQVPMRDGVFLSTNVYRPDTTSPLPVLLVRTPYDAIVPDDRRDEWPGRGFVYVGQDVRGKFRSQHAPGRGLKGEWEDGQDTLDWIVAQPWCNGSITMYGGSYLSMTQLAAAGTGHAAITSFTPALIGNKFYHKYYWGGAPRLLNKAKEANKTSSGVLGGEINDIQAHPLYDHYWKQFCFSSKVKQVEAPAFIRTGWFDLFFCDAFDLFNDIRQHAANECARNHTRMLVGPWPHEINKRRFCGVDFGDNSDAEGLYEEEISFMQYFTAQKQGYDTSVAPLRLFIMGANTWRDENEWPLARTQWTPLYLGSKGSANSAAGDGCLAQDPSGHTDTFRFDPNEPIQTAGGAWGFDNIGMFEQSEIEAREDVLVYTAAPCEQDIEVTGPIRCTLYASSSAVDTDFTVKLVDVHPDGSVFNITDGIVRARYHTEEDELITPDKVYCYTIDCVPTAYQFKAGHRIRVEVSSSNYPAFEVNLNTGMRHGDSIVAHQTIHHTSEYPSHIMLPVIPDKNR